ncbi:hypothetical protein EV183_003924 [Coemansia sp. RSA 2336]|nr:hypothetical protein EV183_003924 [Coemansia sp. RSA 2336]
MNFALLPEDILLDIYKYAAVSEEASKTLPHQLQLLSVCQRLRRTAFSLLFNTIYFSYTSPISSSLGHNNRGNESTADKTCLSTNLDMFKKLNCLSHARAINIHTRINYYPIPALQLICGLLQELPNITSLSIQVDYYFFSALSMDRSMTRYEDSYKPLVRLLGDRLPSVKRLWMYGSRECPVKSQWFDELQAVYAKQLQELNRDICASDSVNPEPFSKLTSLSIKFTADVFPLVMSFAPTLKRLQLYNVSTNNESLEDIDLSSDVEFTELKYLSISYRTSSPPVLLKNALTAKLNFPQLEYLRLYFWNLYCPILAHARLPAKMRKIDIESCSPVLDLLFSTGVSQVKTLLVTALLHPEENNQKSKRLLHKLFSRQFCLQTGGLRLDKTLALSPDDLLDLNLTVLQIGMSMGPEMVVKFIDKLHALRDVNFTNIAGAFAGDSGDSVRPFVAPLHRLTLIYPESPDASLVNYLVLRLWNLRFLIAKQVDARPICDHVQRLVGEYPHIKHICFSLQDEDFIL